jgi:hypothetical protein
MNLTAFSFFLLACFTLSTAGAADPLEWSSPDRAFGTLGCGVCHKPWLLKHKGVVYHFYRAVGNQGRAIALATSRPLPAAPLRVGEGG